MSPAAVLAARKRHQRAFEEVYAERFTLGSTSYAAAIHHRPATREMDDHGTWVTKEIVIIKVRKAVLATPPARGSSITIGAHTYQVHGELAGANAGAVLWRIQASRKLPSPS